jgi:hypothetical protein
MADNSVLPVDGGTETFANDDIGGVKYPRVKLTWGADGASTDASAAAPIPVVQTGAHTVQAVQSGTWNITNVSGTVSLPTGAATAAKQPALGTAGSSSTDVISVQGIASGTALPISGSVNIVTSIVPGGGATHLGKAEDAAHSTGDTGVAILGVRRDTAASGAGTDGDYATVNLDANGKLWTNAQLTFSGVAASVNNGTTGTETLRVTLASDSSGNIATIGTSVTPGTAASNLGKAEDAAHNSADVGVMALAVRTDTATARAGTDGDYIPLITDSAGRLHVNVGAGGVTSGTSASPSTDVLTVQMVGGSGNRKSITMTTDTSAYASGDLIADTQQLDAFFRIADGSAYVTDVRVHDSSDSGVAMFILLHGTTTSMGTENSAPNISDANAAAGIQAIIPILTTDYLDIGGCKVASVAVNKTVKAVSGTDDLYVSIVNSTGTPTFAADSLILTFGVQY